MQLNKIMRICRTGIATPRIKLADDHPIDTGLRRLDGNGRPHTGDQCEQQQNIKGCANLRRELNRGTKTGNIGNPSIFHDQTIRLVNLRDAYIKHTQEVFMPVV